MHFNLFAIFMIPAATSLFVVLTGSVTDSAIELTWGSHPLAATAVEVSYAPAIGDTDNPSTQLVQQLPFLKLRGLVPDTDYTVTIQAKNGNQIFATNTRIIHTREYIVGLTLGFTSLLSSF